MGPLSAIFPARWKDRMLSNAGDAGSPRSRGRFGRCGCHTDLPGRQVVFLESVLNLLSGELSDDLAGVLLFIQVAPLKIVIAENAPPISRFAHAGLKVVIELLLGVFEFLGCGTFFGHLLEHLKDLRDYAVGIGGVTRRAGRELA